MKIYIYRYMYRIIQCTYLNIIKCFQLHLRVRVLPGNPPLRSKTSPGNTSTYLFLFWGGLTKIMWSKYQKSSSTLKTFCSLKRQTSRHHSVSVWLVKCGNSSAVCFDRTSFSDGPNVEAAKIQNHSNSCYEYWAKTCRSNQLECKFDF